MHPRGVKRLRETLHIMESQKIVNELPAVNLIHISIPGRADEERQKEARNDVHTQEFFQVSRQKQIAKNNAAGKNNPDWAFCHHRQAAANVKEPITAVQETQQSRRQKKSSVVSVTDAFPMYMSMTDVPITMADHQPARGFMSLLKEA